MLEKAEVTIGSAQGVTWNTIRKLRLPFLRDMDLARGQGVKTGRPAAGANLCLRDFHGQEVAVVEHQAGANV
jgi:hypothetical protein